MQTKLKFAETELPEGRSQLSQLIRESGDVIDIENAARILGLSRTNASKRLARLTTQGWLRRVSQGTYLPVPLDSLTSALVLDDPWILVPPLYSPAYIGGRTATEYWDLTEQLFKDIVVITARPVRTRNQQHHGARFTVKHIQEKKIFGLKPVWRHQTKIMISDVHRTIIDLLDDPALGGGIQHVADCLAAYLDRPDRHDTTLMEYAERLGNGAIFKRLGFLLDGNKKAGQLVAECLKRITKGNAKLDPTFVCSKLVSRWHLWIPPAWVDRGRHD